MITYESFFVRMFLLATILAYNETISDKGKFFS